MAAEQNMQAAGDLSPLITPDSIEALKARFMDAYRPEDRHKAFINAQEHFKAHALENPETLALVDDAVTNVFAAAAHRKS